MALNSEIALEAAVEQLRSHQISELFTQTLGWQAPSAIKPVEYSNQLCLPIAEREGVLLWQVTLKAKAVLTPVLRHQIYAALQRLPQAVQSSEVAGGLGRDPLVVFSTLDRRRSLWCESATESAVYVSGSPMTLWRFRLRRFAIGNRGLFPTATKLQSANKVPEDAGEDTQMPAFAAALEGLYKHIDGIESYADRRAYSVLTFQRLIFVQQVQQKGWLAGDTWYLQTRFGESMMQGENLFFETCLQPLYRSLSLPRVERPLAQQQSVGAVPFLGQLFEMHWLEQKYEAIGIADCAFEDVLGWLSEQSSGDWLNPWMSEALTHGLAQIWNSQVWGFQGAHRDTCQEVGTSALARKVSDRTLDTWFLSRLNSAGSKSSYLAKRQIATAPVQSDALEEFRETFNDRLFNADIRMCRRLVQEILPQLRILDPGCGTGSLLVAFHQRLTDIFCILTGYIQQNKDAQLTIWQSALYEGRENEGRENEGRENEGREVGANRTNGAAQEAVLLKNVQERILKNNLYGVATSPMAAETAHFQLLLHLVATTQHSPLIEPLMDLEFSVMSGNALAGFITVDEEHFDRVNTAGDVSVLQGNLLQPLAADSYQTILSEKNIALEHYQSRTQVLAKAHSVPPYARAALLREEILTLDSKAQHKLDTLLLNQMSQQMGMRYREVQLTDKPQRRALRLSDVEALKPFHWGYHFNTIVKGGGFDVVACCLVAGVWQPTVGEFLRQFQELAEQYSLSEKTFKTSKLALQKAAPEVASAWLRYQNRCAFVADYFSYSEAYRHQSDGADRKAGRRRVRERLFVERCANLLAAHGVSAVALPESLMDEPIAATLVESIQRSGDCEEATQGDVVVLTMVKR